MPRGRPAGLSISQLENMLQQRRGDLASLRKERTAVERDLARLDKRIESLGGGKVRGGRSRNNLSLNAVLASVLEKSDKPMKVGDIVEKVLAAGYRSSSANFRGIVNQTLIKEKGFSSAGHGLYQLKK